MDKSDEKVVYEKTYQLKLKFYNTDRKMKSIIRHILISIMMHPNYMHICFRQISFKSASEVFTPNSGYLSIALNGRLPVIYHFFFMFFRANLSHYFVSPFFFNLSRILSMLNFF